MQYENFQLVFGTSLELLYQTMYTSEGIAVKHHCIKKHEYNNPVLVSFLEW